MDGVVRFLVEDRVGSGVRHYGNGTFKALVGRTPKLLGYVLLRFYAYRLPDNKYWALKRSRLAIPCF